MENMAQKNNEKKLSSLKNYRKNAQFTCDICELKVKKHKMMSKIAIKCSIIGNNFSCNKCRFTTKIMSKLFLQFSKKHAEEGEFS